MINHIVMMEHHGIPITVSLEGHEAIRALVQRVRVCGRCGGTYAESNPRVALNLCCLCFIAEHRQQKGSLSLIGQKEGSYREGGEYTYLFVDGRGQVYYSLTTQKEAYESAYETLLYHGFPVPVSCQRMGREHRLEEQNWHIHGDIHDQAVVIRYYNLYGDHLKGAWLTYKATPSTRCLELDKHKSEVKRLFTQARVKVEATKQPNGDYIIGKGHHRLMHEPGDEDLYEVIAELESRPESDRQAHLIVDLLF